ncbi:MAG TPA: GNAT family N-acetyltransferase [Patescibacteria group bacterium]|nr:GNAT family N-acetyltransferase [Patescibacteria group bacterium]
MLRCVPYDESLREAWDELAISRGTIFHTTAFRQVLLHSFGYRCGYHGVVDDSGRLRVLLPLVLGRNLSGRRAGVALPFVNYTDICADGEESYRFAAASLLTLRQQLGLNYLEIRLKDQDPEWEGWQVQRHNVTFELPLAADEDQILALSSGSNRNHVRKAYKHDDFAVSFENDHLEDFYRVYVQRMKQLGSPAPDIAFFRAFFAYLPDNTYLLTVLDRKTKRVIGGMLLLTSPANRMLYYPYGANRVEYNAKYLNNFMYWEAVRFGIRQGLERLDLGRSPVGSGTYRYKEQWGAQAIPLQYMVYTGGCDRMGPPDRERFRPAVEIWKRLPAWITDRLGRRLIPYVMP